MPFKFNPITGNLDLVNAATSATPGGATTNVQYNNAGAFAGESNFVYDNGALLKILELNLSPDKVWVRGNGSFESYSNAGNTSYFGTSNGLQMLVGINYLGGGTDIGVYNRASGTPLINQDGTVYSVANGLLTYDTSVLYFNVNDTMHFDNISTALAISDIPSATDFTLSYAYAAGTGTVSFTNTALVKRFTFNGPLNITSGGVTLPNAGDIAIGTGTGTKIGTGTTQKIGFWNNTPIIRPTTTVAAATFVANTGTAVNDASTFDGYTIKQVVKALRNIGLIA